MIHIFEGNTADEVWKGAASVLQLGTGASAHLGRGGGTREILHAMFSIREPRQRWIVSREPSINPAFAIAELVWLINGRRDSAFLTFWNSRLAEYTGTASYLHGAYGYRLRSHFGLDQLERSYQALKSNSASRQIVLQIWDPASDFPLMDGQPANADIPCNTQAFLKVRDGKLEWMQVNRSNDIFLGVPHNLVQFTGLQEILAGWLGLEVGSYNHLSDSLHLYDTHNQSSIIALNVTANRNNDSLAYPKEESENYFRHLVDCIDALISPTFTEREISVVTAKRLPHSFHNLRIILIAEAARRKKWIATATTIIQECDNPALVQLWERWWAKVQRYYEAVST